MNEYLQEAREELKRVDHIIYVSLKYTRTVDIIRNALNRMLSAFDVSFEGILEYNKEKKNITAVPKSPKARIDMLRKLYPSDTKLLNYIRFYIFLRDLIKVPYTRREEYRRHVTMTSLFENRCAEIDIDVLEDNFDHFSEEFVIYAESLVGIYPAE